MSDIAAWEKHPALKPNYVRLLSPEGRVEDVWRGYLEGALEGNCGEPLQVFHSQREWEAFLGEQREIHRQWRLRETLSEYDRQFLRTMAVSWFDRDETKQAIATDRLALAKRIAQHEALIQVAKPERLKRRRKKMAPKIKRPQQGTLEEVAAAVVESIDKMTPEDREEVRATGRAPKPFPKAMINFAGMKTTSLKASIPDGFVRALLPDGKCFDIMEELWMEARQMDPGLVILSRKTPKRERN